MIIFIDESGDAGFQISKGSSSTFTVIMVIFDDELDAEEASLTLKRFKKQLGKSDAFEFKFNKSSKSFRLKFLNLITSLNFRVRAVVFQKKNIYSLNLRRSKEKFYNYVIKCLLEHNANTINNARIRIDSSSDRRFKKELEVYLRRELNKNDIRVMKNMKFMDSSKNILIQLADMIAGSINRRYAQEKTYSQEYLAVIQRKIEDIWEFK